MPYIVNDQCELCAACVSGCQSGAITEGETQCHIDPEICTECGTCAANCPFQAIHFVDDTAAESCSGLKTSALDAEKGSV